MLLEIILVVLLVLLLFPGRARFATTTPYYDPLMFILFILFVVYLLHGRIW